MPELIKLKTAEIEKNSHREYFNIAVSVDCVLFGYEDKKLKVLLIRSDLKEFADLFSLLGDLVRPDEDLEEAAYRVLRTRTGFRDVYLEQVFTFGDTNRHPSGRVITTAYYSMVNSKSHQIRTNDQGLGWQPVDEVVKMAFDHQKILTTCLQRLRERIMEEPIVFNLLPEKFSLRELQDLYASILGIELDRRNFRKRIMLKNWLVDLNEMEEDVPHRPGKLYKLKNQLKTKGVFKPSLNKILV